MVERMTRKNCRSILLLLALVAFGSALVSTARAHGDMHEQIVMATKEIEKDPRQPELYLKRADLERNHSLWDAAHADIGRAEALTNQWVMLHLARARLFLDCSWFESAKLSATRFLASNPNHAETLTIRARAQIKLGELVAGVEDYNRAITNSSPPAPDLYVERAQALIAAGGGYLDTALEGLEQGMVQLGPLVTLQSMAIGIEVQQKHYDAGLARIDKVMAPLPRKEMWLARRGEILLQAGRKQEALEAYQSALAAMDKIPPARRNVPAMAELEQRLRTALADIAKQGQ